MSKVYIQVEETTADKAQVMFCHHMPFDKKNGMDKTEAELLETGYLVKFVESEVVEGYMPRMFYVKSTNTIEYEYEEITPDETILMSQEVERLREENQSLTDTIDVLMTEIIPSLTEGN